MKQLLLKAFTPGEITQRRALTIAYSLVAGIVFLDTIAPSAISFRILYVFPLALFSIHIESRTNFSISLTAIALGVAYSIFQLPLPLSARYTQFALGTSAFFFVAYLVRTGRLHYLEIQRLATHDVLTGLRNRQALQIALESEMARLARYGTLFSLAIIDLDGFKQLNDSRGHDQGDAALRLTGQILSSTTRRTDTLARIGGDEFALLMPNTGTHECERTCSMLVEKIGRGMADAGFAVTASIGATAFNVAPESAVQAIKRADEAMYLAKGQGKARAVIV